MTRNNFGMPTGGICCPHCGYGLTPDKGRNMTVCERCKQVVALMRTDDLMKLIESDAPPVQSEDLNTILAKWADPEFRSDDPDKPEILILINTITQLLGVVDKQKETNDSLREVIAMKTSSGGERVKIAKMLSKTSDQ